MNASAAQVLGLPRADGDEILPSQSKSIQASNAATMSQMSTDLPSVRTPGVKLAQTPQHLLSMPGQKKVGVPTSGAFAGSNGFEGFLNLTPDNIMESPLGANQAIRVYDSLASEHADLLLKYKDLSRRHAETQSELQALRSSTTLSTTAVLSDMYTDLNKSYDELEASYKRELELNEPFRAKIAELQHDLLAANDLIASLRHDFRLQQSRVTDLEVRFHLQSQSMADVTNQCSELQTLAENLRKMLFAAETDLQDARTTIERLNSDILDANDVSEELSQQVLRGNNYNKVLLEQLNKFMATFDDYEQSAPGGASPARTGGNSSAAVTSDLSPSVRILRLQRTPSAVKSILEENIRLATSLQMNLENSKDTAEALTNARQQVVELNSQILELQKALDASKEREKIALQDALECKQSCDSMITDIKEQVSHAWEVEEQKQLHLEARMSALKIEAEDAESAKQEIAHFKQLVTEHDEMIAHLQRKHELEREHSKLLLEEEQIALKQQHDDEMKRADAKIQELTLQLQEIESSLSVRVQDEISNLNNRFRQEQQRFSSQLESSVEMLNESREQRSRLLEITAAKTQEIDELTTQLLHLNKALRMKEADIELLRSERESAVAEKMAEIESIRRAAAEEAVEKQRLYEQKQAEDKQVMDSSWAALTVIRKEIEESAFASSQIQLGASTSKLRLSLESEIRQTFEAQINDLQSRLSAADNELKRFAEDRDLIQQKLMATQQELEKSADLQSQMKTVEASFLALRANFEASARTETQLRDVIQQQDVRLQLQQDKLDAAAAAVISSKNLESVVLHLNELLHLKESECEVLKRDVEELREKIAQQESASARDTVRQTMTQSAESRAALENLRIVSEELQTCKAQLEQETRMRVSAQEQLAATFANREDVMQAARDMISTERQRFDQQSAVDQARLLELQLELKRCKDRLRVTESEEVSKAGRAAA